MNREIKFRGMDIQGRWFVGNLAIVPENNRLHEEGHYISNSAGMPFAYQVRPETVGQYTGLKDKNDVPIYEGDIVEYDAFYMSDKAFVPSRMDRDAVEWSDGCYRAGYSLHSMNRVCEVIGNIYENKELLEVVSND